jgi:hypothetical protein
LKKKVKAGNVKRNVPADEGPGVTERIRLRKHTSAPELPDCGSYEVCLPDGRESIYFYYDDNPARRSICLAMSCEEAERKAKELAQVEQYELDSR